MAVLICKNIRTEGPGTIGDYLKTREIPCRIVELSEGERIPDPDGFDVLVIMGGPMSANDTGAYPYIEEEEKLVDNFISKGKKVFGICLGAQIIAKALGSSVYRGEVEEVGWHDIELTYNGLKDTLMRGLALHPVAKDLWRRFKVFHWHGETFDIPKGAVRLAGSELYLNQAFKYRDKAYAFQFHIEVTKKMIYDWFSDNQEKIDVLRIETERFYDVYNERARQFYELFFKF